MRHKHKSEGSNRSKRPPKSNKIPPRDFSFSGNRTIRHPKGSPKRSKWAPWGDRKCQKTPPKEGFKNDPKKDPPRRISYQPPGTLLAALGRSKGPFGAPAGSQKGSKIVFGRLGRHLGWSRRVKRLVQRGVQNGIQKKREMEPKMRGFGRPFSSKSDGRYCFFVVLRDAEKY